MFVTSRSMLLQYFASSFPVATRSLIRQYSTAHRSSDSFLCLIAAWILASSLNRVIESTQCHYAPAQLLLTGQHDRNPVTTRHEKRSHAAT